VQVGAARTRQGRDAGTSLLIVDAQSVKNTDTAAHKGYEAGKKVSGIKAALQDTQCPLAIGHIRRRHLGSVRQPLRIYRKVTLASLGRVQGVLCDSGCVGQPFEHGVKDILGQHVTVQIAKRSELHTFKVLPRRWVIEHSFAWLEKSRRLWKNCERRLETSLQFVHLAFLALLLRRL
jgi:transposase